MRACRSIRLDFTMGAVFGFMARPDFAPVDRVNALARRYRLQVDAVLTGLPFWLADCPADTPLVEMSKCPPRPDAEAEWARMVMAVVRRSPAVSSWELGNEPDVPGGRYFIGTPSAYARVAAVTARAIRAARPSATIVLGGTSRLDRTFLRAVLKDGRNPLAAQIDVAAVHLRGSLSRMRAGARACAHFFHRMGVRGPLWVTETGYPSNPSHQWDRTLTGGERDQARWIARGTRRAHRRWRRPSVRDAPRRPRVRPSERLRIRGRRPLAPARCGGKRHPEARLRRAAPARRDGAGLSHDVDHRSAVAVGSS